MKDPCPLSQFYVSCGVKLHYWDYGTPEKPPLVLVHGGRDHARSWDQVANALRRDFHVYAIDLRGHGDSSAVPGGVYSIGGYLLDLNVFCDAIRAEQVHLVGHSLGAYISLCFASAFPQTVAKVAAIEGLGPARYETLSYPERIRRWIDEIREIERTLKKPITTYPDAEAAANRLKQSNARLSDDLALLLAVQGTNRLSDGTLSWKFDNYVRAGVYSADNDATRTQEILENIRCPVLLINGGLSAGKDDGRQCSIRFPAHFQSVNIADAGHFVHHDQLDAFLCEMRKFLGADDSSASPAKKPEKLSGQLS